jgi:hypothetical protein
MDYHWVDPPIDPGSYTPNSPSAMANFRRFVGAFNGPRKVSKFVISFDLGINAAAPWKDYTLSELQVFAALEPPDDWALSAEALDPATVRLTWNRLALVAPSLSTFAIDGLPVLALQYPGGDRTIMDLTTDPQIPGQPYTLHVDPGLMSELFEYVPVTAVEFAGWGEPPPPPEPPPEPDPIVLEPSALDLAPIKLELGALPSGELGYGADLSCVLDLTDDLAEVDPLSPVAIGEATLRRLLTARGSLPDHRDYGLDVRGMCNRGVPYSELRDLAGQVRNEISKDDRIESATVTVTLQAGGRLDFAVRITPAVVGLVPFSLTFAVVSGQLTVEAIGA